jgi:Vitamin-D-receptor interacting Mediator subunit 4
MSLLETAQKLIEVERSLTLTMERVEPWLPQNSTTPSAWHGYQKRVRPIPTCMEQVESILAVARSYSSRTSAPAGWNPSAPVVGFSTPSPLPHQLRAGALAALQLERARQDEHSQKRKRQEEAEAEEQANAKKVAEEETKKSEETKEGEVPGKPAATAARRTTAARPAPQVLQTTMNLSDSSSEEDDSE